MPDIEKSYFFKWLSDRSDFSKRSTNQALDGVIKISRAVAHFDVRDGKDDYLGIHEVVICCNERAEPPPDETPTTIGVDVHCDSISGNIDSNVLDLIEIFGQLQKGGSRGTTVIRQTADSKRSNASSTPSTNYRGTFSVNRLDLLAYIAELGLRMTTNDLRVSAFSQLRHDGTGPPSFASSFRQANFSLFHESNRQSIVAQLNLDLFSAPYESGCISPGEWNH